MSNQTLCRTRMMFVSLNIAVKWVSYGNDGHFSRVCWGAFRNYEWNILLFGSFSPYQDPEQVDPDQNLSLHREVFDWNISSGSIILILTITRSDYSPPTNAFCHFVDPFCSALNQFIRPGFVRYSVAVIVEQRKLKF